MKNEAKAFDSKVSFIPHTLATIIVTPDPRTNFEFATLEIISFYDFGKSGKHYTFLEQHLQ